jgi:hypothetical protein
MAGIAVRSCNFCAVWKGPVTYEEGGDRFVARLIRVRGLPFSVSVVVPYAERPHPDAQRLIFNTSSSNDSLTCRVSALPLGMEQMKALKCFMDIVRQGGGEEITVEMSPPILPETIRNGALYRLVLGVDGARFEEDREDPHVHSALELFPLQYQEYIGILEATYNIQLAAASVAPPPLYLRELTDDQLQSALILASTQYQHNKGQLENVLALHLPVHAPMFLAFGWEFGLLTVYYGEELARRLREGTF